MKAFISGLVVVVLAGVAGLFLFGPQQATSARAASGPRTDQTGGKSASPQGEPTSVPTCAPSWVVVTSPDVDVSGQQYYGGNQFLGVSVVSPDDVWAVGYYTDPGAAQTGEPNRHVPRQSPNDKVQTPQGSGGTYRTLVEHYDGTAWTAVPSPNNSAGDNVLNAVVGIAADDVWAVGTYVNGYGIAQTLAMHWDGETWSLVDSPNVGPLLDNRLTAIDAAATDDVWAVGYYYSEEAVAQTLTMHWDGNTWSVVASPNVGDRDNNLYAITVVAPNDAWAVGAYAVSSGYSGVYKSLALHWNGVAWTVEDTPSVGSFTNVLYGVDAAAPDDIWAVGLFTGSSGSRALILHWNGAEWAPVLGPDTGATTELLYAVSVIGPNDAWAVGQSGTYASAPSPMTIHWDGTEWSKVRTPNVRQNEGSYVVNTTLLSIDAAGGEEVWSVGYYEGGSSYYGRHTLTEHYSTDCVSCPTSFVDVQPGSPFYPYVQCLSCQGIVSGYACENPNDPCYSTPVPSGTPNGSGYFRPNSPITRGQLAKLIASAAQFDDPPNGQNFQDVNTYDPFYYWIYQLGHRGIIAGYPCGTRPWEPCGSGNLPYFRPNDNATRGQIAKIVSNARGYEDEVPASQQSFVDVPHNSPFWLYVERLKLNGSVISGYSCGGPGEPCPGAYFRPQANASRGQVAKIVSKAFLTNCYVP